MSPQPLTHYCRPRRRCLFRETKTRAAFVFLHHRPFVSSLEESCCVWWKGNIIQRKLLHPFLAFRGRWQEIKWLRMKVVTWTLTTHVLLPALYYRNGKLRKNEQKHTNLVTLKLCIPNTAHLLALQPTTRGADQLFDTNNYLIRYKFQSWIYDI